MRVIIVILQIGLLAELTTKFTAFGALPNIFSAIIPPTSVCYGNLGCFSIGGNFFNLIIRPIQPLPSSPELLDPKFWLFTRSNVLNYKAIRYGDIGSVTGSGFDPRKKTKIICHGWTDSGDSAWMVTMKKALLNYGDYNVIQLDWQRGSKVDYPQAASNTRVVGAVIARMVSWLGSQFGANQEDFHIIGHSLGAHVAGYAGARLHESDASQLGRITGLDPAGPYFENAHPEVRLDPTDARFVDAIHTDAPSPSIDAFIGCGILQPVGHIDFYPNGGSNQPDCPRSISMTEILSKGIIPASIEALSCDHRRVRDLFEATLLNPGADFRAYQCDSYAQFKAGRCLGCSSGSWCAQLGIRANEWSPSGRTNVKVWSDTQGSRPFYVHHYAVTVTLASTGFSTQAGDLTATLLSEAGQTTPALTVLSNANMQPGASVQSLVTSGAPVANVYKVNIGWKSNPLDAWISLFEAKKIAIDRVTVLEGDSQKTSIFCGYGVAIDTGSSKTLNKC